MPCHVICVGLVDDWNLLFDSSRKSQKGGVTCNVSLSNPRSTEQHLVMS